MPPKTLAHLLVLGSLVTGSGSVFAQVPLISPDPANDRRPPLPSPAAPPAPSLQLAGPPPGGTRLQPATRRPGPIPVARVQAFRFVGNSVFTSARLTQVVQPWLTSGVSTEDLVAIRNALTTLYIANGYVNSGATIPDQDVTGGVITINITEGTLDRINVSALATAPGAKARLHFRPSYFRSRLQSTDGTPLNIAAIENRLRVLHQDARVRRLDAQLRPGDRPGRADLEVRVQDATPYRAAFEFSNHQAPSVGAYRGRLTLADNNLFGNADALSVSLARTGGFTDASAGYQYPLTASDLTAGFEFRNGDSTVIEEPFDKVAITSRSRTYSAFVTRPFWRSPEAEWNLGLRLDVAQSQTYLLGQGFTFSEGAVDGKARVTALRVLQDWTRRDRTQVFSVRTRISIGLPIFGATTHDELPSEFAFQDGHRQTADGRFVTGLAQFQWARRLTVLGAPAEMVARVDAQLASEPLLSIEQFAMGGSASIRGYRENQLVRDSGVVSGVDLRFPIVRAGNGRPLLLAGPMLDAGTGWNRRRSTPDPHQLTSAGVSVTGYLGSRITARAAFAHGFTNVATRGDLQDRGVHFDVTVVPW